MDVGSHCLMLWVGGGWRGLALVGGCHRPVMRSRQLAPPLLSGPTLLLVLFLPPISFLSLFFYRFLQFVSHPTHTLSFVLPSPLLVVSAFMFPFFIRLNLISRLCTPLFFSFVNCSFFPVYFGGKLENFLRTNPINEPPPPPVLIEETLGGSIRNNYMS